jgi:putative membrane protein
MMDWDGGGWSWGQWLAMTLSMLAVWGVLIAAVVIALRGWPGNRRSDESPQRLLGERFARGELSEDAYRRTRHLLDERDVHCPDVHESP